MIRDFFTYCLLKVLLVAVSPGVKSQDLFTLAKGEQIEACTDRSVYIAGEKVFFSAVVFHAGDPKPGEFSRIVYCELITPDGSRIAGGKYLLEHAAGQGCLIIPEETLSGIYFLKFYTRFMRNNGTEAYTYKMLKIVNPFKTEVLPGDTPPKTVPVNEKNGETASGDLSVNLTDGKDHFSSREEISLEIHADAGSSYVLSLSVIPEFTCTDIYFSGIQRPGTKETVAYFPETRGISISGKLTGKESGNLIPGAKMYLSIIGDRDILVVRTDSSGRFFFALPGYQGKRDLFLSTSVLPDVTPEILIDNDFCSKPVTLPSYLFSLSDEEMKAAYSLAVNFRISSAFSKDTAALLPPVDSTEVKSPLPFYGKPTEVLLMDKYIDLPTLEEYFTELGIAVTLRRVQGRKQFRFYTTQTEMTIFDPLVLVDWVAVDNIDKILAMSPLAIDRIELVNSPYVKGNMIYGGIISFVSRKNDFAGIDLPASGTFVNYTFTEDCDKSVPADLLPANIPDARNTVYWNPSVQVDEVGNATVSFTAPDTPGNYTILMRKLTPAGEIISIEKKIVVTQN